MKKTIIILVIVAISALVLIEPALAAPGGKIARAVFETFWGRVILGLLTIVFLPLILYTVLREKFAERRARKDLRFMAGYSAKFDWLNLQQRIKDCFYRIHAGWSDENLSSASDWMTDWYWQNQQMVHLERWKKEGLVNICKVKRISKLKPLLFVHRNQGAEHQDSMVAISITANMQDYLQKRGSGEVVEGSKRYKQVETVWVFTLTGGEWKVSDIEEDSMSLAYAKMAKELPAIETTVMSDLRV